MFEDSTSNAATHCQLRLRGSLDTYGRRRVPDIALHLRSDSVSLDGLYILFCSNALSDGTLELFLPNPSRVSVRIHTEEDKQRLAHQRYRPGRQRGSRKEV